MCRFGHLDGEFRVDTLAALSLHVLRGELDCVGQTILGQNLRNFGDERNALSHSFNLYGAVLLENDFA